MEKDVSPMIDGYSLVARALERNHIRNVYGVTGIPVTKLSREIQCAGLRYIGMHNEQAASYAAGAEGYLTGKPGVCLTVSAPGFVNALAGLANATVNCFPMVLISGSSDRAKADLHQGDYQELDQVSAAREFAKAAYRVDAAELIGIAVARAVRAALSGRPGGVYLDLPARVLHEEIPAGAAEGIPFEAIDPSPVWVPSEGAVKRALALLKDAERPLIVLGKGAAYARAEGLIAEFVERTGIPFLPSPMGKGILPEEHPRSAEAAHSLALRRADVVMLVGCRLNWIMGHGRPPVWPADCKFIQLDICPDEIDSNVRIAAPVVGDIAAAMERFVSLASAETVRAPDAWRGEIADHAQANREKLAQAIAPDTAPMNFGCAFRVIREEMSAHPDAIFVSEGANTLDIGRAIIPIRRPRTRLDAGTWGTMGVGLAYAIAAAVAQEGPVVAAEGDSAFGFSGMELETICRYRLPVVVVVFNNGGIYKGDASSAPGGDPDPTRFVEGIRYDRLIEAFGGKGYHAPAVAELRLAVREALAAREPALINCVIDPTAGTESGHLTKMN